MWVYNLKDSSRDRDGLELTVVISTFTAIATLAVALRMYVRLVKLKGFGKDDSMVLVSLFFSIAYTLNTIYETRWGLGVDLDHFPPENIIQFSKVQYAGSLLYVFAILCFKLSLLFSYLRIVSMNRRYTYVIYGIIVMCTAQHVAFGGVLLFGCKPIRYHWDSTTPGGKCINNVLAFYWLAGLTCFFDFVIIGTPLPVLMKLQLARRRKIILCCLFAMGFFVTLIQILRISSLKNVTNRGSLIMWSTIEADLGIVITCIPTLAPLIRYFHERGPPISEGYATSRLRRSRDPRTHSGAYPLDEFAGRPRLMMSSHTTIKATSGPRDQYSNESEERIVKSSNGITATTEITIESVPRDFPLLTV